MKSNYQAIIENNLQRFFADNIQTRAQAMGADPAGRAVVFRAFGGACRITPEGIFLEDQHQTGPQGIILSLYALNAHAAPPQLEPFKAFKEIPDSMPYVGAFASHTEQILVPEVDRLMKNADRIMTRLNGRQAPAGVSGDAALVVHPLPKIALCYIFYAADDDFPAAATCLYSSNAHLHMPVDGLADVGEYTSRAMLEMVGSG